MTVDASVSLATAAAVALGTVKSVDIVKQGMEDIGIDKIPPLAKHLLATTLAVVGSAVMESGGRRRILTACAASGLAAIMHSFERANRHRADLDHIQIISLVPRVRASR